MKHFDQAAVEFPLTELWDQLVCGRVHVVDTFHSEQWCYLLLELRPPDGQPRRPLSERKTEMLARTLRGERQKAVAVDLRLAPSTIALTVSECLKSMGLDGRAARVPIPLVMAAHALTEETPFTHGRASELALELPGVADLPVDALRGGGGRPCRVVSVPRPDTELGAILSGAEHAVARLLVEGKSYAEMAWLRGTSVRTVANQVASIFQKTGVSGRAEFLSALVRKQKLIPRGTAESEEGSVVARPAMPRRPGAAATQIVTQAPRREAGKRWEGPARRESSASTASSGPSSSSSSLDVF